MGVGTGAAGGGRHPNIFADHKNRYIKKNENEKKGRKVCFLMQRFFCQIHRCHLR